jgi:ketosteroid isomerase-like protein
MEATGGTGAPAPAPGLTGPALALLEGALRAVEAKDVATLRALVADDGVFVDPHYPAPRMVGWAAIEDGLRWAFGTIEAFGFEIVHGFETGDGRCAAVEVDCHHVLRGGRRLVFRQVFVADIEIGRIRRLQAYEPYGPGGLVGWVLRLTRFGRRLRGFGGRLRGR